MTVQALLRRIKKQLKAHAVPSVTRVSRSRNPFKVLVSCIVSLRTKDAVTIEASQRLFRVASTPRMLARINSRTLEKLIYPAGFYRTKAMTLKGLARVLVAEYKGKVPRDRDCLLALKGVGRKTANLVLGLGFGIPAICVDTHVHRISNRLGWVKTKSPLETEVRLQEIIPRSLWIELNTIFVGFGQDICVPISPKCSQCAVAEGCKKVGVKHFR